LDSKHCLPLPFDSVNAQFSKQFARSVLKYIKTDVLTVKRSNQLNKLSIELSIEPIVSLQANRETG
jgi:hypothetical protein